MNEFTAFLVIVSVAVVCAAGIASEARRKGRTRKAVGSIAVITGLAALLVLAAMRSYGPADLTIAADQPQPVATLTPSPGVAEVKVTPPPKPSVRHVKKIVGGHTVFLVAPPTVTPIEPAPQPSVRPPGTTHTHPPNPHPTPTHTRPPSPTPTPTSPTPTPTSPSPSPTSPSPTPTTGSPSPSDTGTPSPSDTGSPTDSPS